MTSLNILKTLISPYIAQNTPFYRNLINYAQSDTSTLMPKIIPEVKGIISWHNIAIKTQFLLFVKIFTIFPESKIREKIFAIFNKFWKNSQKSGTTFRLQNCLLEGLDNSNQVSTDRNNKSPTIINFNNYLKILNRARSLKYYHILTHAPPIYHIPCYCHIAIFHWLLFNFDYYFYSKPLIAKQPQSHQNQT